MRTNDIDVHVIRESVREHYGKVATRSSGCGCAPTCCSTDTAEVAPTPAEAAQALGYSADEISAAPDGANLGLGCGNPVAIASLKPGQTVLDLGSGAGFDAFLAARAVGTRGRVIGVDMTAEMIEKARRNQAKGPYANVEFRLGEIENLPVADNSVDVIISNCVINLSPDKPRAFREAFRVLKPGGRIAVSDVVATAPIPESVRRDIALYAGCVAGTSQIEDLHGMIEAAGFSDIRITPKAESREVIREWFPARGIEDCIVSATIEAVKSPVR